MHQRAPVRPKTSSKEGVLGQQGINLLEKIVLQMRSLWAPGAPNEIGIDGTIELCDPKTGQALSKVLAVQSKAVSNFVDETDEGFCFRCERRDIEYWLQGNLPILLIVSKPATGEAYWVSVKDYFANKENQASLTIWFHKVHNKLTVDSFQQLDNLGVDSGLGLYLAPNPKTETLHSNLLALEGFPESLYVADTDARTPGEVLSRLRASHSPWSGWLFRDRRIYSFHDLSQDFWSEVCDPHSVEVHETNEWADSEPRRVS